MKIIKKEIISYKGKVYDLKIKNDPSYNIEGIVVHNSAAGALLAYCLDIVIVDPIQFGLYFERFMNPERNAFPDIDFDVMQGSREKIREYLQNKYGNESVFGVSTWTLYQPKSALQDASRGLGKDTSFMSTLMTEVTKLPELDDTKNLIEYFENIRKTFNLTPTMLQWLKDNEETIYWANKMLGLCKNVGTHAGGIVIAPGPIYDYIPVVKAGKEINTAFRESDGSAKDLSELGLLKLDILGLKTLNVINESINGIKKDLGIDITNNIKYVNLNDKAILRKFNQGNNVGVFQLEGNTQDRLIKSINPDCFEDIVAINAINRPGPLESFSEVFGEWKRIDQSGNKVKIAELDDERYPFEFMKGPLSRTYGCLLEGEKVYNPSLGVYEFIEKYPKSNVLAYNSDSNTYCLEKNNKVLNQGIKHVNKYTLSTGYSLTCTPDHKIATSKGEMEIEYAFKNNVPILLPKELIVENVINLNLKEKQKLRILGLLLGDGSIKSTNKYLTCSDEGVIFNFKELINTTYEKSLVKQELTNIKRKTTKPNYRLYVIKNEEKYDFSYKRKNYTPSELTEDLRIWGLEGKGSYNKFIPKFIFKADRESKLYLLSGLWDSDGSVVWKNNQPISANYSTMSEQLAEDILLLLRQLGFLPTISKYKSGVYKIFLPLSQFSEISKYCKHSLKKDISFKGEDLMNNVCLYEDLHFYIRKETTVRKFIKNLDIPQSEFYKKNKSFKCFNNKVKVVLEAFKDKTLKNQFDNSYSVIIKEKEEIGNKQVFDLNIQNNPWFVAGNGGITVHNCLLYQEQFMLMVKEAAGFNMGEADSFRRALGWKEDHPKYHTVKKYFDKLKDGMLAKDYSESDVEKFLEYCRNFMGYSFNLCLTKNHKLVSKLRGEINLLDVEIGEEILAYNSFTQQDEWVVVENIYDSGEKEVYKVKTESGKETECSLEHKLMSEKGLIPLKEIITKNLKIKVKDEKENSIIKSFIVKKPDWKLTGLLNEMTPDQQIEFENYLNLIYEEIKNLNLYNDAVYSIARYYYLKGNFDLEWFFVYIKTEGKNICNF